MTDPTNQNTNPNPTTPPVGDPGMQGGVPPTPPVTPSVPPVPPQNGGTPQTPPEPPQQAPTASDGDWGDLSSGNAVLDNTIKAFTTSIGMSPADFMQIVGNAVDYGDPNLIDTTLLNQKYGAHTATVQQLTNALIESVAQSRNAVTQTAYDVAGSKEGWDQAVAIFNANAPDYLKSAVKAMIDNGNVKEGAQMLMQSVQQYGAPGTITPQYSGNGSTAKGLSFDELKAELGKLVKEAGGASLESGTYGRRYEDLMRRRAIGRQQGL